MQRQNTKFQYGRYLQDQWIYDILINDFPEYIGFYLELGSPDCIQPSSTYSLESYADWKGVTIEQDEDKCKVFKQHRQNFIINRDVLGIDWHAFHHSFCVPRCYEYLSINVGENAQTVIDNYPWDEYKAKLITIDHKETISMPEDYKKYTDLKIDDKIVGSWWYLK